MFVLAESKCIEFPSFSTGRVATLQSGGISHYWRFRDDVLLIYHSHSSAQEWFSHFKQSAKPFDIKCESVSASIVEFLEVQVSVKDGKYDCVPRLRSSHLGCNYLNHTSNHPSHIHNTWPISFLKHRAELSSRPLGFRLDRAHFVAKLRDANAPEEIISKCMKVEIESTRLGQTAEPADGRVLRLVLPFLKVCETTNFGSKFRNKTLQLQYALDLAFGGPGKVSVDKAWRNDLPNLKPRVSSIWRCSGSGGGKIKL